MLTRILSLDLSLSTGYALMEEGRLLDSGNLTATLTDFNVNKYPDRSPHYPYNLIEASNSIADKVWSLVLLTDPDYIVIENTVRGQNRHTQRLLEFIHKSVLDRCYTVKDRIRYLDPSRWRQLVNLRLSEVDKKHNADVKKGLAKGKLTKKHLAVRMVNTLFNTEFILKDNDICDAILLNVAFSQIVK